MNDVETWLHDLGLGDYAQAFADQRIDFDLLGELGDDDLKALGVAPLGHRKRMLRSIAALNETAPAAASTTPTKTVAGVMPMPREAERRQLTVMFCDLVGSTALSGRLDPEDLQHLIRSYHEAVAAAIAPFEGHVNLIAWIVIG
jgi:class 3 adenylate cyclase